MIHGKIIFEEGKPHIFMTTYISEPSKELRNIPKKAVLVIPGGGYHMTSDREAEPVAKAYYAAGYNAFVLRYSVNDEAVGYAPLLDALRAVKYIRDHASEWNINKDKLFVCGFSAGGHLAASAGVWWDLEIVKKTLGCKGEYVRPDGMILGYPVITAGEKAHKGSVYKLANKKNPSQEELDAFSLEKFVSEKTPPSFLWHTADDSGVPVENSLYFCESLSKYKVPFELHIFPHGAHGLSVATEETAPNPEMAMPYVARWVEMSVRWIEEHF